MRGFSRWTVLAAFALVACGGSDGGSGGPDITTLFPTEAELTTIGWAEDTSAGGLVVGSSDEGNTLRNVDGAVFPFQQNGLIRIALNSYVKGETEWINYLRIWQLPDAAAAQAAYESLPSDGHYTGPWIDVPNLGDAASSSNHTTNLVLLVRKGAYVVDATIQPPTAEADLIQVVQIVLGKLP